MLAVGFIDHPRVELVSAKDLAPVATLSTSRAEPDQHFISVAWSSDGKSVYAAGSYQERGKTGHKRGTTLIRRWTTGVERTFQLYSPLIASIEVKRRGDVRRAKLYYLRDRSGKSARIKAKLS